jgi:hypothetical protein
MFIGPVYSVGKFFYSYVIELIYVKFIFNPLKFLHSNELYIESLGHLSSTLVFANISEISLYECCT